MNTRLPANCYLLALAQGLGRTTSVIVVAVSVLAGLELTGSDSLAGVAYGIRYAALVVAALGLSMLMNRYGRRWPYYVAAFLGIVAGLLGALSLLRGSFALLLVSHALLAVFLCSVNLYRFTILEMSRPETHQQALSTVLFGGLVAAFLGPYLARNATLFLPGGGFVPVYLAISLLALLVLLILMRLPLPSARRQSARVRWQDYRQLFREKSFLPAMLTSGLAQFMMIMLMGAASLHLHHREVDYTGVTFAIQFHVLAMFVPSLFSGRLLKRWRSVRMISAGLALLLMTGLQGALFPGPIGTVVGLILLGLGWNFLYTSGSYLVGILFRGQARYLAQGLTEASDDLLSAISAFAGGVLLQALGWSLMNVLLLLPVAGYVLLLAWRWRRQIAASLQQREAEKVDEIESGG